ncbi:MAG: DUF4765 family protein [Burkholderiales bacterium]|nr:DUF4765 family protein [Burkholderiales bacterium]
MPITLKDTGESLTPGALAARLGFIDSDLDQALTRMDFMNSRFANLDALVNVLKGEIGTVFLNRGSVTADSAVALAVSRNIDLTVTLVRGTAADSAVKALSTRSAGGEPRDPGCGRPSSSQVISQVGGSQPGKKQVKLPEFTAVVGNSDKWAKRGGWLFVRISTLYLVRGDLGERGWVCLRSAPVEMAQFVPHPNPDPNAIFLNAD